MAHIHPELIRIAARQVRVWRSPFIESRANLFLIHGGFGNAQWHWHTIWETLADAYNIAAPDLPCFGGTVELPNASFAELVEWLARVQELLGMSRAAFIGNSFGAALARLYTSAHPERVTHLILVNGGQIPRVPKFARGILRSPILSPMFELARRTAFTPNGIKRAFANAASLTPESIAASQDASHGLIALMRQLVSSDIPPLEPSRVPTLVIWGERDKLANLSRANELAAEIPNSELAIIKNAGHMPQLEDPLSFVKIVREFCNAPA